MFIGIEGMHHYIFCVRCCESSPGLLHSSKHFASKATNPAQNSNPKNIQALYFKNREIEEQN